MARRWYLVLPTKRSPKFPTKIPTQAEANERLPKPAIQAARDFRSTFPGLSNPLFSFYCCESRRQKDI